MRDRLAQPYDPGLLKPELTIENFTYGFAHQQLVQILEIGQPFQEQDALDQFVSVLGLLKRLSVFVYCIALSVLLTLLVSATTTGSHDQKSGKQPRKR